MATNEKLAGYVRAALADVRAVREVRMFGGLGFMLHGNLVACADGRGLLVRVGEEGKAKALTRGAKPMVMNGREMRGFVWVEGEPSARAVSTWLRLARTFVDTLPAKKSGATAERKKRSAS